MSNLGRRPAKLEDCYEWGIVEQMSPHVVSVVDTGAGKTAQEDQRKWDGNKESTCKHNINGKKETKNKQIPEKSQFFDICESATKFYFIKVSKIKVGQA